MESKLNIVPGEAPESDDEEIGGGARTTGLQGTAVMGEAPESSSSEADDADGDERLDSVQSVSSAASVLSLLSPIKDPLKDSSLSNSKDETKYNSLLHKKLRERNASLRRSVEDYIHQSVGTAARDLNSIDQHLLKSQVTLQEAATSLRILQSNLSHIHSKLSSITSSTYLPSINVNKL